MQSNLHDVIFLISCVQINITYIYVCHKNCSYSEKQQKVYPGIVFGVGRQINRVNTYLVVFYFCKCRSSMTTVNIWSVA